MKTQKRKSISVLTPQTHRFDFYRDNTGWYIDFPEFIAQGFGSKADLAMVAGADQMLEYLGNGQPRVALTFSNTPLSNASVTLKLCAKNQWGGTYTTNLQNIPQVWLCNVTKHLFNGAHPYTIYIQ